MSTKDVPMNGTGYKNPVVICFSEPSLCRAEVRTYQLEQLKQRQFLLQLALVFGRSIQFLRGLKAAILARHLY